MWSGLPRNISISAHDWSQVLTFQGKSCSHFRSYTHLVITTHHGKLGEGSTELAPMIEFLAQGSIKPEPPWLVPLRKPKMPENEWKPVLRLFH